MLFPDARERSGNSTALGELVRRLDRESAHLIKAAHTGDGRLMAAVRIDPHRLIEVAQSVDWHYPVLIVYRTTGDTRWSHVGVVGRPNRED